MLRQKWKHEPSQGLINHRTLSIGLASLKQQYTKPTLSLRFNHGSRRRRRRRRSSGSTSVISYGGGRRQLLWWTKVTLWTHTSRPCPLLTGPQVVLLSLSSLLATEMTVH